MVLSSHGVSSQFPRRGLFASARRIPLLLSQRIQFPQLLILAQVYLDESGFERTSHRAHGWGLRGKKVYGECSGNKRPGAYLISAKQGRRLLAPILFEGSTNAVLFNYWLENHLFKELAPDSTIIMDNATFRPPSPGNSLSKQDILFFSCLRTHQTSIQSNRTLQS